MINKTIKPRLLYKSIFRLLETRPEVFDDRGGREHFYLFRSRMPFGRVIRGFFLADTLELPRWDRET